MSACACDSRYDGCDHPNPCGGPNDGTGRGPWCADCQPRRLDSIRASLENLRADFAGGRGHVDLWKVKFLANTLLMAGLLWFLLTMTETAPLVGAGSGPWWGWW